tara:strand:+ start:5537 stop:5842 length:306 start_codon:yes stop_codon:yes gene_type:complete
MEKIFLEAAQRNMLKFNVDSFKKTHPKLYATILDSMLVVSQENEKAISAKFMNSLPSPDDLKVIADGIFKNSDSATRYAKASYIKGSTFVLQTIESNLKNG